MIKGIDIKDTVNKAIKYVKSNPCCICSLEGRCGVKYKGTCKVRRQLMIRLCWVKEIGQDEV